MASDRRVESDSRVASDGCVGLVVLVASRFVVPSSVGREIVLTAVLLGLVMMAWMGVVVDLPVEGDGESDGLGWSFRVAGRFVSVPVVELSRAFFVRSVAVTVSFHVYEVPSGRSGTSSVVSDPVMV